MGDSSSNTPLALKTILAVLVASLIPFSMADAQTRPAKKRSKSATSRSVKPAAKKRVSKEPSIDEFELDDEPPPVFKKPKPKPRASGRKLTRLEYDAGVLIWTEKVNLVSSSGKEHAVVSNATSLLLGADWRRGGTKAGWVYQAGLVYGNINHEAKSTGIIYQKGRDMVMGAQGGAGVYFRLPESRAEICLLAQGRLRQVTYTAPSGYNFDKDAMIIAGFAEIDLSIPISKSVTLFQQFSMPLHDERVGTTWAFGLRL